MSGPTRQAMEIGRIAAAQHGLLTWAHLRDAGMSREAVAAHVDAGWLRRPHRGIYQLGVFGGPFAPEMAALLVCGPNAAISHWSSLVVFGLWTRTRLVHVSEATAAAREHAGIRWQVQVQSLATPAEILSVIERGARRPGVRKLRAIADLLDEPLFTRSEAERRLLELVRSAKLPTPLTNVRRAGWEVDAVWEPQKLVVEVDGYRYHRTRAKFERDRRKDADLMLAGYRVLRVTWRRLVRERRAVGSLLRAALGAGSRWPSQI